MSARRVAVSLILSTSTMATFVVWGAMTGCSGDEPAASDGGSDTSRPEANRPAPPESDARAKTCREQCEEAHPVGLPKDEAVNSCWNTHCRDACIEEMPGDGGTDGAAPDGGTCIAPVVTISLACDECTNTSCCAEWDGCFEEPECVALNACYQQCTE